MTVANQNTPKPWKGMAMEGRLARWYARIRSNDMQDFCRQAESVAARLHSGSDVLEVAPGPGFFSVELAKLGDFHITGLDISHTCVGIASENAREANVQVDFRRGNPSDMPFADESFDLIYCSAAFYALLITFECSGLELSKRTKIMIELTSIVHDLC